jgi:hypothetical protein
MYVTSYRRNRRRDDVQLNWAFYQKNKLQLNATFYYVQYFRELESLRILLVQLVVHCIVQYYGRNLYSTYVVITRSYRTVIAVRDSMLLYCRIQEGDRIYGIRCLCRGWIIHFGLIVSWSWRGVFCKQYRAEAVVLSILWRISVQPIA